MSDNTESSQESSEQKQVTEITFIQTLTPEMIAKLRKRKQQDISQKKTLDNLSSSAASRLLSAKIVFDKFEPKLITDKTIPCKDLDTKIKDSDYLFFDFSRGTTQECDVMYSLVKHYGIKDLAITTDTSFEVFIKFCKGESLTSDDIENLEDLKLANSRFTIRDGIKIRAISVEMIKTISLLLDERIISNIHRVNPPQIDSSKKIHSDIIVIDGCGFLTPYAGSINKAMADQVLEIKSSSPILVFVPEIFRGRCYEGEPTGDFWHNLVPCSISHYIEEGAKKTLEVYVQYELGSGHNNGLFPLGRDSGAAYYCGYRSDRTVDDDEYRFEFPATDRIALCY